MEPTTEQVMQIMATLFIVSEVLAQIPWIKANSIFQLCVNVLRILLKRA